MGRLAAPAVALAVSATGFGLTHDLIWLAVGGVGAALAMALPLFRCRHPRPLGLLPPVSTADGRRQGAQWFCSACGTSWPASIERTATPVPRFQGHDESKAKAAAGRARVLDAKRRDLAMRRAGMKKTAPVPSLKRRQEPVPIRSRRAG